MSGGIDPYYVVIGDPSTPYVPAPPPLEKDIFRELVIDSEEFSHYHSHLMSMLAGVGNAPLVEEFEELKEISRSHLRPPPGYASLIPLSKIEPSCPNFIASASPFRFPEQFWNSVWRNGPLIVQLNSEINYLLTAINMIEDYNVMPVKTELLLEGKVVKTEVWLMKNGEKKVVTHYLINNWEDGNAFRDTPVIDFVIDLVKKHVDDDPTHSLIPTIHCTAGIGRTGTFLAYYLKRHLCVHRNEKERVDPLSFPRCVTLFLRMHRHEAVHTMVQYLSIDSYDPN